MGTLAYMAWLNELGVIAVSARTQDIDLARRQRLALATPMSLLDALRATGLPFAAIPGLPSTAAITSLKLPGAQGLRVDLLAPGKTLGASIKVPELAWAAHAIPYYEYLLADAEPGAALAGGHCIPVRLPQAARFVWHKLYASTRRRGSPEKAMKDRRQAFVLAARLAATESHMLLSAFKDAPASMTRPIRPLAKELTRAADAAGQPELVDVLRECLEPASARP